MNRLDFILLQRNDSDIPVLKKFHILRSVKKFISISKNYFDYVTETENVFYYKILLNSKLIGGIHFEIHDIKMYISLFILPDYRNCGYGKASVKYVLDNFTDKIEVVEVAVDEENYSSIRLFEGLGFKFTEKDGNLYTYIFNAK